MGELAHGETSREGQLLAGKYRLEKHLGSGAMGDVYKAQNTMLGRIVAIKLLRPEHAQNKEIVDRFMREALAANLVRHVNVVDVIDVGQDENGSPYIVQEFLEGEDFSRYIERLGGRLEPNDAIDIMLPVIEAIEFAHARGVVHRDIKPENIYLARDGDKLIPKLLDFGISQVRTAESVRMTATGLMMGTPAYMSPEQIVRGAREADAQTDVWALGIMLFEVLAGQLPFMAETASALFVDIATKDAPKLSEIDMSMPPDLVQIVDRCLRRERSQRYPSGCELARDLRHWRNNEALEGTAVRSLVPPKMEKSAEVKRAAAAILENMDIPAFEKQDARPKARPVEAPNVPQLVPLKKAPTPPTKGPQMTMQEMMESGQGSLDVDEDEDGPPSLELDVPSRGHSTPQIPASRASGQMAASQPQTGPTSRKVAGHDTGPHSRATPQAMTGNNPRRVPEGFHGQPSNHTGGAGDSRENEGGAQITTQDVVGYTALTLIGIVTAGLSRLIAHREESGLHPFLESMKGNSLMVVPGLLCVGICGYLAWQAGKRFQGGAKYAAGVLAAIAGLSLAVALDLFGST